MAAFFFWYAVIFTWIMLATDYETYKRDKKYVLASLAISVAFSALITLVAKDLTLTASFG